MTTALVLTFVFLAGYGTAHLLSAVYRTARYDALVEARQHYQRSAELRELHRQREKWESDPAAVAAWDEWKRETVF